MAIGGFCGTLARTEYPDFDREQLGRHLRRAPSWPGLWIPMALRAWQYLGAMTATRQRRQDDGSDDATRSRSTGSLRARGSRARSARKRASPPRRPPPPRSPPRSGDRLICARARRARRARRRRHGRERERATDGAEPAQGAGAPGPRAAAARHARVARARRGAPALRGQHQFATAPMRHGDVAFAEAVPRVEDGAVRARGSDRTSRGSTAPATAARKSSCSTTTRARASRTSSTRHGRA